MICGWSQKRCAAGNINVPFPPSLAFAVQPSLSSLEESSMLLIMYERDGVETLLHIVQGARLHFLLRENKESKPRSWVFNHRPINAHWAFSQSVNREGAPLSEAGDDRAF
ncbi:hypothetical protein SKAU_G00069470 [Synaphobranchus kaupii]|uniref:Uncharacterized protein n=1 Tax=Synaphobranchus kaupii TaxID=118154 RepID=A0A9Q1JBK9_SYNKA|nr:hypothetical protein SKAU_G00069470 [Synaphobranchus kaupii]